jgi:hypothetical protein
LQASEHGEDQYSHKHKSAGQGNRDAGVIVKYIKNWTQMEMQQGEIKSFRAQVEYKGKD